MSDAIDRYAGRRSPPRPPEIQVGTPAPGRADKPVFAKWDDGRSGKRYMGHAYNDDGTLKTDPVQWLFLGDPGDDDILETDQAVQLVKAPTWIAADAAFGAVGTYGEKYVAMSPIWGVLG